MSLCEHCCEWLSRTRDLDYLKRVAFAWGYRTPRKGDFAGWGKTKRGDILQERVFTLSILIAHGSLTKNCKFIPISNLNNALQTFQKKGVNAVNTDCSMTLAVKSQNYPNQKLK